MIEVEIDLYILCSSRLNFSLKTSLRYLPIMSIPDKDRQRSMEEAKVKFCQYSESHKDFQPPQAHIEIDYESDHGTRVHINTEYHGIPYKFESIQEKDIDNVYQYLNSQPLVREKFADGVVQTRQATTDRMHALIKRFQDKNSPCYLFSAFIVSDAQTDNFLGFANLGGGSEPGTAEMARLNRIECWSRPPSEVVIEYGSTSKHDIGDKIYSGIGTAETCTLLQYAAHLKEKGYLIYGHPLKAVVATARVDNEGSWKSNAKAGMKLQNVGAVEFYGSKMRYLLRKDL